MAQTRDRSEPGRGSPYVLGHSAAELRRLKNQAREIDPVSRRFLAEAGVTAGMRVLDVGTGAGDTALLLADVVGSDGEVVGFDRSAVAIEAARAKAAERSLHNVTFLEGTAGELSFDTPFDAVFGRYVLQFQPDPAALLAAAAAHAKPGGLIVFHELDWSGARSVPPAPTYDQLSTWAIATVERSGADAHMGLQLPRVFAAAGLPEPELRLDGLIVAGERVREVLELKANLAETLAPAMVDFGIATPEQLGLDTLVERLVSEATANGSVIISRFEVGAWARLAGA
jgi:SAM-dependent methyltransferase